MKINEELNLDYYEICSTLTVSFEIDFRLSVYNLRLF